MTSPSPKSVHTGGPWNVAKLNEQGMFQNNGSAVVMGSDGDHPVAEIVCHGRYPRGRGHNAKCAERDANARLIAAAPDLLDALKAHDAYMADKFFEGPDSTALHPDAKANWKRVRAAIANAEGTNV